MAYDEVIRTDKPRIYPAYKPSGIEWLGEVPEHWELRKLRRIARLRSGEAISSTDIDTNGEYPVYGGNGLRGYAPVHTHDGRFVLIGRQGALCGCINYAHGKFWASEHAVVVNPTERVAVLWLGELLRTMNLNRYSQSAAQPGISVDTISALLIPIAPLAEQEAIAAYLDRETARVDGLIERKRRQIELLREKRAAVISRAVTKGLPAAAAAQAGLDPNAPMKPSGIEWLGDIPAHWEVAPIRSLARKGAKNFTDGDWIESPHIRDEGIRLIQTGNVGIGVYKDQGFRYIDLKSFASLRCTEVIPGDLLICRLAEPVGRACIAPELNMKMITSVDVCILRTSEAVNAGYFVYVMSDTGYLSWINAECRGGTRDRVSRSMLGAVRVQRPPLAEQEAIAAYLDRETARVDGLIEKVEASMDLLREYRTALISAAVTGKIDVRGEAA